MAVVLYWSAGRIDWWPAWAALAVMAVWIMATTIVILRFTPALLAERLGPRKGAKPWDTALILRTALEDRTLQTELIGYHDYAQQVRYRLLPGIW